MADVRKKRAPPKSIGGALKSALLCLRSSVAQFDRPAEAGVVVPVMMRETEHLLSAYFRADVEVKRPAGEALPSGLRLSAAPQAVPLASMPIEFASPCAPPVLTVCPYDCSASTTG